VTVEVQQRAACGRSTAETRPPACSPLSLRRSGTALNIAYRSVNGDPSAVLFTGATSYAVIVLDLAANGDPVCGIYAVANPDKFSHVLSTSTED
jgi:hypothetical protein